MTLNTPKRLVLDTSLFVNPESQRLFGESVEEALDRFMNIALSNELELYMPISIFRELSHFTDPEVMNLVRRQAVVRGPDLHHIQVPAAILHSFIQGLRARINAGLRVAESAVRRENAPDSIRWVRERYRSALRTGIVDSVEDLDVVLMAKEVGGAILSEDQGIANMAEDLGIEVFSSQDFLNRYDLKPGGSEHV